MDLTIEETRLLLALLEKVPVSNLPARTAFDKLKKHHDAINNPDEKDTPK